MKELTHKDRSWRGQPINGHRHLWDTPVDDHGNPSGPTTCEVCGKKPGSIKCVNCHQVVEETVLKHGSLQAGFHSTRAVDTA